MEVPIATTSLPHRPMKRSYAHHHQQQQHHHQEIAAAPFQVTGVHAMLFDDDALAAFINSPAALLPWNGDESLLIDRYDVRHLLQDLSGIRKRRPAPTLSDAAEKELNYERYRDLEEVVEEEDLLHQNPVHDRHLHLSPQETTPTDTVIRQTESGTKSTDFVPPFPVPDFLQSKLPPSQKLHQIIVTTAKFVNDHGGQSEILLKVKQGDNPMFGFLNVDNNLHEYYKYLLKHPELLQPASQNTGQSMSRSAGEGLSLLGSAYGSCDDDDDDDGNVDKIKSVKGSKSLSPDVPKLNVGSKDGVVRSSKMLEAQATSSKGSEPKATRVAVKGSSRLNKKKKFDVDPTEYIQRNKSIVPQLPLKDTGPPVNKSNQKRSEPKGTWHAVPSAKDMDYGMSADAAAAVVLAATRGMRGLKQDSSCNKSSSSSGLSQRVDITRPASASVGSAHANGGIGSEVNIAKAIAQAAAVAASHEADSADALLTPAEKLKAERLRRAKMFAAMIKSGNCPTAGGMEPSGLHVCTDPTGSGNSRGTGTDLLDEKSVQIWNHSMEKLAIQAAKDSSPGHIANGKPHATERVEDSDADKFEACDDLIDSKDSKQQAERHRGRSKRDHRCEVKESRNQKHSRSDSEESRHHRKRRHRDHRSERKHRHSRHRRHESHGSDDVDNGASSESSDGESRGQSRSKAYKSKEEGERHGRRRHHHNHKTTHDERHFRDRDNDKDSVSHPSDEVKKFRKYQDKDLSPDEEDATDTKKTDLNKETHSHCQSLSEPGSSLGAPVNSSSTIDVPEDIRAKVREMLLSTL